MKKMLLLVGMLAVSGLAFAKEVSMGGNDYKALNATEEQKIEVKAKVVAPLAIQNVVPVDFGIIVKGQTQGKTYPDEFGGFEVKGEKNQAIAIYVKDDDGTYEKVTDPKVKYNVALVKDKGSVSNTNQVINATMNVLEEGRLSMEGTEIITLPENGTKRFSVGGRTAPIGMEHEVGEYRGYLHVKAQYE